MQRNSFNFAKQNATEIYTMATRKYNGKGKGSKGRKNRTQKGGFLSSLKGIFGFSNQQKSGQSQYHSQQQQQQQQQQYQNQSNQQQNAGSDKIPEMSFGGKKKRGRRNK